MKFHSAFFCNGGEPKSGQPENLATAYNAGMCFFEIFGDCRNIFRLTCQYVTKFFPSEIYNRFRTT